VKIRVLAGLSLVLMLLNSPALCAQGKVSVWLTNHDKSVLFEQQSVPLRFANSTTQNPVLEVNDRQTFQTIDGFGFALTGGSAQHIFRMDAAKRAALLRETFATDGKDIGVSYLRVSIGASDLNDHVFSYDDMPAGETDQELQKFSIAEDRAEVIPVLKEILAINPKIKILGSPWSAPAWMKTNGNVKGGRLKPEYYGSYAKYFVAYIQAMKAEGIAIDAVTVQNEPLNEKNTPSMEMVAEEEAQFIKNNLGPAFAAARIKTKIILYDHNCDVPEYALTILKDPAAAKYVDGSGFHLYGGKIEAMSQVHDAFPAKNLYFTEFMAVDPAGHPTISIVKPVERTFIGATRNWSRNVLLWNLAANSKYEPHTGNGGCGICQGAVTIDGNEVTRNLAFYAVAHFSKFVRPGSVRIASPTSEALPSVAFKTPGRKTVLVVANSEKAVQTFAVRYHGRDFVATLPAESVATYVW